jgi:hypothetical protein
MSRMKCLVTSWILLGSITGLPVQTQSGSVSARENGVVFANRVNTTTLTGTVMCGYQGWFAVPADAINRGWYHYRLEDEYGVTRYRMDDLGAKMPSGICLCCLQSGSQRVSQKMLLIK